MATTKRTTKKTTKRPARKNAGLFGPAAVAKAKKVTPLQRVKEKETGQLGTIVAVKPGFLKVKWDHRTKQTLIRPSAVAAVNPVTPTYKIAMAAGRDAGDRSMKKAGRKVWSQADWNAATRAFNSLWPPVTETVQRKAAKTPRRKVNSAKRSVPPAVAGGSKKRRVVVRAKVIKKLVINKKRNGSSLDDWHKSAVAAQIRYHEAQIKHLRGTKNVPRQAGTRAKYISDHQAAIKRLKASVVQNPDVRANSAAARKFEAFQGRPATKNGSADVSSQAKGRGTMYPIGKLIKLKIRGVGEVNGAPGSLLLADTKDRLWISGKIGKARPGSSALEPVGAIEHVVYRAHKAHIVDGMQDYIHKLGEETGAKPMLYIDPQGFGVIKGGAYRIDPAGIIN